jgi:hypothetical protein
MTHRTHRALLLLAALALPRLGSAADLPVVSAEGQPLAANATRLVQALDLLGAPLPKDVVAHLRTAAESRDALAIQEALDPHVLLLVAMNPESRVKVLRGPASAVLQQAGYTPVLVKVINESTITKTLKILSPQAGPPYAGVAELSLRRQQQTELQGSSSGGDPGRFLHVEMFTDPPMTDRLSGLGVEYAIALLYSSESGKREATIGFDVGQGTQDLGFRGETPVLFDIRPAVPVRLSLRDHDGAPTIARLEFRDQAGHVYPPQPRRLAPDLFFQPHIYRADGETVLLPPGRFRVEHSRGPEYRVLKREIEITAGSEAELELRLERWINPREYGYYGGDHHIHGAGCAHYSSPTEGVTPLDMFRQVKGEGLNVGCVLTWGPCFEFQRQYFAPKVDDISEPLTILKYDLEISGFGSQALGHVCLLNLRDQTYPGSDGTKTKGWPTWTTPVMRWAKQQGGVTGYAHSGSGLEIDPEKSSQRLLDALDTDDDEFLTPEEAATGLLPEPFEAINADRDRLLSRTELVASHQRAAGQLPNFAIPEMNGVGAMEVSVSTALGVCDFISAMDTPRIAEWNSWYHILNCGFPLKVSGETDFPCMSSTRVGKGRVYVKLGEVDQIDFAEWCRGLAAGRSYVSDGYAHAVEFTVDGADAGDSVALQQSGTVEVRARVAFAPETPRAVAHGLVVPTAGLSVLGDTKELHGPRLRERVKGGARLVEVVLNGRPIARREVPADGNIHELKFSVPVERSSWIALRHFPQMHTNPVNVLVAGEPIRASRRSAQWCIATIEQLWRARHERIAEHERDAARRAFDEAIEIYRQIAAECPDGT